MAYLLDTHTFLWFIAADNSLSPKAKSLIETTNDSIYLSIASLWEMAIKVSIGKLTIPPPFTQFMLNQMTINRISLLAITPEDTGIIANLPFHHRDPFDRILIAQSLTTKFIIISKDDIFDRYNIQRLW